ncbi:hypothetical protein [Nocardia sp. NBC_01327]|uniref:hypothetical protein n=1 Tax=Nocardia sp. NBC_01327 TaxID=2903593 RepID=UPI002E0F0AA2|nr:hypothetical protein OG326_34595 [Nocardia sp. NBC_01327]
MRIFVCVGGGTSLPVPTRHVAAQYLWRVFGTGEHDRQMQAESLVVVELSDDERHVLRCGLNEWVGPARSSEALAVAMGFASVEDLYEQGQRLRAALSSNQPLSASDWRRALVATEFVFASDVFGSGVEWPTTTGLRDEETIRILRGLQRKLNRTVGRALYGHR